MLLYVVPVLVLLVSLRVRSKANDFPEFMYFNKLIQGIKLYKKQWEWRHLISTFSL